MIRSILKYIIIGIAIIVQIVVAALVLYDLLGNHKVLERNMVLMFGIIIIILILELIGYILIKKHNSFGDGKIDAILVQMIKVSSIVSKTTLAVYLLLRIF